MYCADDDIKSIIVPYCMQACEPQAFPAAECDGKALLTSSICMEYISSE